MSSLCFLELSGLIDKFANTEQLTQSGVIVAVTKYMYLSPTDKVICAKKGTNGVHTIKTTRVFIANPLCQSKRPV